MTSRPAIISHRTGAALIRSRGQAWLNIMSRTLADDMRERGIIVATISRRRRSRTYSSGRRVRRAREATDVIARSIEALDGPTLESGPEPTRVDGAKLPW